MLLAGGPPRPSSGTLATPQIAAERGNDGEAAETRRGTLDAFDVLSDKSSTLSTMQRPKGPRGKRRPSRYFTHHDAPFLSLIWMIAPPAKWTGKRRQTVTIRSTPALSNFWFFVSGVCIPCLPKDLRGIINLCVPMFFLPRYIRLGTQGLGESSTTPGNSRYFRGGKHTLLGLNLKKGYRGHVFLACKESARISF